MTTVQWNPCHPCGEQHFGRYIGVALIDGLFCTQTVHLGPGCLHGRYIAVGLYSGVAVKRGSIVSARRFRYMTPTLRKGKARGKN